MHKHGLSRSPTKKSNGVKSHDLGDQLISPRREITRPGNGSCNKAIFARVVWHVAPSFLNHVLSKSYSLIASIKCRREIRRPGNISCKEAIFARVVWQRFVETTYSPSRILQQQGTKVRYHMTITLRIDGDSGSIADFEEIRSNQTFGPKSAPFMDVMASLQLLEDSQNPKYDNFVY